MFSQFDLWLKSAVGLVQEPTAMCLATVGPDSQPNARYVLLKEYNEKGFVFYSNNDSTKGEELERVRKAALCFYWEPLERQVCCCPKHGISLTCRLHKILGIPRILRRV